MYNNEQKLQTFQTYITVAYNRKRARALIENSRYESLLMFRIDGNR